MLYIYIALEHVYLEDKDKNYMLLWPSTEVGNTHNITEPCGKGMANIV